MVEVGTAPVADSTMLASIEYVRLTNVALERRPTHNVVFMLFKLSILLDLALKSDGRIGGVTDGNQVGHDNHSNEGNKVEC